MEIIIQNSKLVHLNFKNPLRISKNFCCETLGPLNKLPNVLRSTRSHLVYRQLFSPAKSKMQVQKSVKEDKAIVFFCLYCCHCCVCCHCCCWHSGPVVPLKAPTAAAATTQGNCRRRAANSPKLPRVQVQVCLCAPSAAAAAAATPATTSNMQLPHAHRWPPTSRLGLALKPRHLRIWENQI